MMEFVECFAYPFQTMTNCQPISDNPIATELVCIAIIETARGPQG